MLKCEKNETRPFNVALQQRKDVIVSYANHKQGSFCLIMVCSSIDVCFHIESMKNMCVFVQWQKWFKNIDFDSVFVIDDFNMVRFFPLESLEDI